MDKDLLILWQTVPSGAVKLQDIANILMLSQKQTSRRIQKWSAEGWLTFKAGRGRGHLSSLTWIKDVEAELEERVKTIIATEPVDVSSNYLLFNWSMDAKFRLMNLFRSKFGYVQEFNDKLIIPRRYPFLTLHPLEAADVHSANLILTIYNRLIAVDENGSVLPELAHSWDNSFSKLTLYLKKGIQFHDGTLLSADDVVYCLERMRTSPHYQKLWEPIEEIVSIGSLVVEIRFPKGCSYCLQLLGTMNASIYKESENAFVGTGSFYIEDNDDTKTTLIAFKDYYGERPLLDRIEFIQVPLDFDIVYRSSVQTKEQSTFQVESESGFGLVVMNAYRNSAIAKKEVRAYLHHVISRHRHEISSIAPRLTPNTKGCLANSSTATIPTVKKPEFMEPLLLKVVNYNEKTTLWLKRILEEEGIPVELKRVAFQDTLNKTDDNENVDLFIHGELFEMNEDFSFFYFLQNGSSPLYNILESNPFYKELLNNYAQTPFEEWRSLNLKVEQELMNDSIIIPLYYDKRQIPFSNELTNINIKHFGFVDFSKLWIRPSLI